LVCPRPCLTVPFGAAVLLSVVWCVIVAMCYSY
jgi:hypothetical protein